MKRVMAWVALIGMVMLFVNIFFIQKYLYQSMAAYSAIVVYYLINNLNRNHDKKMETEKIRVDDDEGNRK